MPVFVEEEELWTAGQGLECEAQMAGIFLCF